MQSSQKNKGIKLFGTGLLICLMELMNKYAKGRVKLLGPNQTPEVVDRIGKTMMFFHYVNEKLEREIGVHPGGNTHAQMDKKQDIRAIINQLKMLMCFLS